MLNSRGRRSRFALKLLVVHLLSKGRVARRWAKLTNRGGERGPASRQEAAVRRDHSYVANPRLYVSHAPELIGSPRSSSGASTTGSRPRTGSR
jgi:hypothetical protein